MATSRSAAGSARQPRLAVGAAYTTARHGDRGLRAGARCSNPAAGPDANRCRPEAAHGARPEEGVIFKNLTNPLEIKAGPDGRVSEIVLQVMKWRARRLGYTVSFVPQNKIFCYQGALI